MSDILLSGFQPLAEGAYLEGLAIDSARSLVWYSDVVTGGVYGVDATGEVRYAFNKERKWVGGILLNSDGAVLSSGPGGIFWNNPESGEQGWLLASIDGKTINGINELWSDGHGGIIFGTVDIESIAQGKQTASSSLYRLSQNQKLTKLADDIHFSNGFVFDAANYKLFVSDSFNVAWAYDVADDMTLHNRRVLLDKKDCDGMVMDSAGNIWISGFSSPGVIEQVTAGGEKLTDILLPFGAVTQMRFGGVDMRDLYLTVVPARSGDTLKKGEVLQGGSYLYRARSSKAGVASPEANFLL
jgi:sugar lactone lactonase YvrE